MSTYPGRAGHDREGTRLHVGDYVLCQRPEGRPLGSWPQYQDRVARVVNPNNYGEVIVEWQLDRGPNAKVSKTTSFVPAELLCVGGPPKRQRGASAEPV